jgi:tRNA (cmo5U34)-methyltransferase
MSNEEKKPFSFDTITNFDNHILQSVPNYDLMFNSILRLSDYFKDESKVIYDIGCSTGNLLRTFKKDNNYKGKMVGIDVSRNLLPTNTREFENIDFVEHDLNTPYVFTNACIVYSMYTLQFLQREARQNIIRNVYNGLTDGGAFFICEKVYNERGIFQDMFTSTYYDYKKLSFTEKEIFDKERSLRTMLKPNTQAENYNMLFNAGFRKIETFYKYFNFVGTLCIK